MQISDKLQQYWAAEEPIIEQGATTDATQSTAAQQQMKESLDPIYEDIYADMIELMNTKVTEGDRLSSTLTAVSVISCDCGCGSVSSGNGYGQQAWQSGGKGNLRTA